MIDVTEVSIWSHPPLCFGTECAAQRAVLAAEIALKPSGLAGQTMRADTPTDRELSMRAQFHGGRIGRISPPKIVVQR